MVDHSNPYVGPEAFGGHNAGLFFGRDREAKKLLSLISSRQIVLFYAPSGAGKTSLINARIVPVLEERGFRVLSPARVGRQVSNANDPLNIYTLSVLSTLSESETSTSQLQHLTLEDFLKSEKPGEARDSLNIQDQILILDQFEEILTTHPGHRDHRDDFFLQIRQALNRGLLESVLFVMREDHIAGLDRFAPLLPDRLRTRFRMDRLQRENAAIAIRKPAARAGRPFAAGVAEALAENLCLVKSAEEEGRIPGEFVEPVQLQVVCFQLWQSLKATGDKITAQDLADFGSVDHALEVFYEKAVQQVAQSTGISESRIRRWFGRTLINSSRLRNQICREKEQTGGLPDRAVKLLISEHLIRPEIIRGSSWVELVHDRFIDPILASNEKKLSRDQAPLKVDAKAWQQSGHDASFLPQGQKLEEHIEWSRTHRAALGELEHEFLEAANLAACRHSLQLKRNQERLRALSTGLALALVAVLLLLLVVLHQIEESKKAHRISESNALAVAALNSLETDPRQSLDLALLAAMRTYSVDRIVTVETEGALRKALHASRAMLIWSGLTASASAIALDVDGKRLATGNEDGRIQLWDTESGVELLNLPARGSSVNGLAFSPDRQKVAAIYLDHTVRIWDLRSAEEVLTLSGHLGPVNALAFAPSGRYLATGSDDATARVWDAANGTEVWVLSGHNEPIYAVAFSPDEMKLATTSGDTTARLWNVASGEWLRTLTGHESAVNSAVFSRDGKTLFTASSDQTIKLWNLDSRRVSFSEQGEGVQEACFSPDGKYLITATFDGRAQIRDLHSNRFVFDFSNPLGKNVTAFSPNGQRLAMVDSRGQTQVWELIFETRPFLPAHHGKVHATAFSPRGESLATGSADHTAKIWNAKSGQLVLTLEGHSKPVRAVAFNPLGDLVATASEDRTAKIWNVQSGELQQTLSNHAGPLTSAVFSPDGRHLATTSVDGTIGVWDTESGVTIGILPGGQGPVMDAAYSPDGIYLASANFDGTTQLWSVDSGAEIFTLHGHAGPVNAIAYATGGQILATASDDDTTRLWHTRTGEVLHTLSGHKSAVTAVTFSTDGRRLSTGGEDGGLILWDVASGRQLFSLVSPAAIYELVFSPDDGLLAAAGGDGRVRLEPMETEDLLGLATERIGQLPPSEKTNKLQEANYRTR